MRPPRSPLALAIATLLPLVAWAEPASSGKKDGQSVQTSPEIGSPDVALKSFTVAPGLQVEVWASEPLLANPVALAFDEKGRAFVAETHRRRSSVPDIRKNVDWTLPNLALRTVADREAFLKEQYAAGKNLKPNKERPDFNGDGHFDWKDLEVESERIKLIEDRDGDGKADTANVFAEGFNKLTTGVAAGVLAQGDDVWVACIPELWRIRVGSSGQQREPLATGFGVHVVYSGHDMHGVKMGPDGKIYWTIADCGAHVTTKEGKAIDVPDSGAVFRANPDGSEMELYAWGLRNPQSLAFNELGDLFTGDNNADGGDKARWEHIVEGGDYGWRIGWQFLPKLGAWNSEKLWELDRGQTALSLLPSVGHIGHGPAGIAYYPGTGLPASYRDHFFYADFPGGIRSFALKQKGASYTVENPGDVLQDNTPKQMTGKLLWGLYPSDIAFGVDGGAYVLDWIQGWEKTGKGRIFRVHDPVVSKSESVQETKRLLTEGMKHRSDDDLAILLLQPDQRVRLAAQFELVKRGERVIPLLARFTRISKGLVSGEKTDAFKHHELIAQLHAVWGLGQLAKKYPLALAPLAVLLTDEQPEMRAQVLKVIGDRRIKELEYAVVERLSDPEPRPRFFAAMALAKIGGEYAFAAKPLLTENRDDPYLRHAAVMALANTDPQRLAALTTADSTEERAGALLALRRMKQPEVASFLRDKDPQIVLEAARASHDDAIEGTTRHLASLGNTSNLAFPVLRRVINSNYRLGKDYAAKKLATIATDSATLVEARRDALEALGQWNQDLGRDRVLGVFRPLPPGRDADAAGIELARILPVLLNDSPAAVQLAAMEAAANLKLKAAEETLVAATANLPLGGKTRAAALRALASFESSKLPVVLTATLCDKDKLVMEEALRLSAKFLPNSTVTQAAVILDNGSVAEKQNVLQTLAKLPSVEADQLLSTWLDRFLAGQVPAPIQLDLLESAAKRENATIKQKLATIEANRNTKDPLARWLECLEGGDAKAGREIFYEKAEAACMRCHKLSGVGGDVGPDLAAFGKKHDRKYILTSIVAPNAIIASGYENTIITQNNGNLLAGIISAETAEELTLTPVGGGEKVKVKINTVKQRDKVPSAMPEGLGDVLGKRDLRNVVEFLAELK